MKPILLVIAIPLLASAALAQTSIPAQRLAELRSAIQQTRVNARTPVAPRQLTPEERAELRRQVQQQSRRPPKP
jgi:hypothetical protein